jgi:preprotein translocase subunit SecA
MRREILHQPDISKRIKLFIEEEAKLLANSPLATTDQYEAYLRELFPFTEKTLDALFDTPAEKFGEALDKAAKQLYKERETAFTADIMRKVERDIYLQLLDNLWMQHLENMDHLREGIHWISVGQRDPLVEYRRQGQHMFEEMQAELRHDVVRSLFAAEPTEIDNAPAETELTRAARKSVDNADKIIEADEFTETDFVSSGTTGGGTKKKVTGNTRKKARKAERQRRKKGKKK